MSDPQEAASPRPGLPSPAAVGAPLPDRRTESPAEDTTVLTSRATEAETAQTI